MRKASKSKRSPAVVVQIYSGLSGRNFKSRLLDINQRRRGRDRGGGKEPGRRRDEDVRPSLFRRFGVAARLNRSWAESRLIRIHNRPRNARARTILNETSFPRSPVNISLSSECLNATGSPFTRPDFVAWMREDLSLSLSVSSSFESSSQPLLLRSAAEK